MRALCSVLLLAFQALGNASLVFHNVWDEWRVKHHKVYANEVGL